MRHLIVFALFIPFWATTQNTDHISVYFDFNSDHLKAHEQQKIDSLLATPNIEIKEIIAFCDPIGSDVSNFELGSLRNRSVSNYLISKGFKASNDVVIGEKDSKNAVPDNYSNFRRVDIHYLIPVNVVEEKVNSFPDQFKDIKLDSVGSSTKPVVLNIQFAPGQDILIGNSYNEIMNLFAYLRAHEDVSAFIRGHVCCSHDPMLSSARAYVVYSMLVERGISTTRLRFEGFSNTIPAVYPETNELDRQANRRVDVIFSKIR